MDSGLRTQTGLGDTYEHCECEQTAQLPTCKDGAAMVLHAQDGGKNGNMVCFKAVGWGKCSVKAPSDEGKQRFFFPSQYMNCTSVVTHLQTHVHAWSSKSLHNWLYCDHWPCLPRNKAECKIQILKKL